MTSGRQVFIMDGRSGEDLRAESGIVVSERLPILEPDPIVAGCPALNLESLNRGGVQLERLYRERSAALYRLDRTSLSHPIQHFLVGSRIVPQVPRPHSGEDVPVLVQCSYGSGSAERLVHESPRAGMM